MLTLTAYPVRAPVRGHLSDHFFMPGERVKRGQLLAKLERPDGSPAYLTALVAGRIGPTRLALGDYVETTLSGINPSAMMWQCLKVMLRMEASEGKHITHA